MHDTSVPYGSAAEYSVSAAPAPDRGRPRSASGARIGVLLVVLGSVLLGIQLVPGATLVQMWPALVIALGVAQLLTPPRGDETLADQVANGLGTVLIGTVLLSCTLGYVSWSMWWTLLGLWPVLLIAAGLKLLGRGSGQSWVSALAPLLIWAAILYSAGAAWTGAYGLEALPLLDINSPVILTIQAL